jgi:hypothetical protein
MNGLGDELGIKSYPWTSSSLNIYSVKADLPVFITREGSSRERPQLQRASQVWYL